MDNYRSIEPQLFEKLYKISCNYLQSAPTESFFYHHPSYHLEVFCLYKIQ